MTDPWGLMVTVGRIIRPHGHRGAVVVQPETDFADERFAEGAELSWKRDGQVATARVVESREFRSRWVVMFEGVRSMNDAELLRDLELRVPESALHALTPDRHYVHDLQGCAVETVAGQLVGTVERVDFGSSVPMLVVNGALGEVLIPLVDEICRRIETTPERKRITVELPEGLLELNARRGGG